MCHFGKPPKDLNTSLPIYNNMIGGGEPLIETKLDPAALADGKYKPAGPEGRSFDEANLYDVWATREQDREQADAGYAADRLDDYLAAIIPHVNDYLSSLGVEPLDEDTDVAYNDRLDGAKHTTDGDIEIGYPGEAMADHVLHPIPLRDIITHEAVHDENQDYLPDMGRMTEAVDEAIAQYVTLGAVDDLSDETTRKWFHQNRFETYMERWEDDMPGTPHPELYHAAAAHISDRLTEVDGDSDAAVTWILNQREELIAELDEMDIYTYPD